MFIEAIRYSTALSWWRKLPRVRQITLTAIFLMLFGSLLGLFVEEGSKAAFSLIYFCAPIAWTLWICSALQGRGDDIGLLLIAMWVVIDLSILISLISFASPGIDQSIGADITILISYFPVLIPIGLLNGLIPNIISFDRFFDSQTAIGASMILWSQATTWSAVQSIFIYWAGRLSWKLRATGAD